MSWKSQKEDYQAENGVVCGGCRLNGAKRGYVSGTVSSGETEMIQRW